MKVGLEHGVSLFVLCAYTCTKVKVELSGILSVLRMSVSV